MTTVRLRYGDSVLPLDMDERRFEVLSGAPEQRALSDSEIGGRLDAPLSGPPLEDTVAPGETVLFVVPDATRKGGAGQIVNLLVRRLIANGTMPHEIAVLVATGMHRGVTDEEKKEILTPFVAQRLKVHAHNAKDLMRAAGLGSTGFTDYGTTAGGIPVRLNSLLSEYDRVVTVGSVSFHYFAGFTGGRKLICPGAAAEETIGATHRLAFDFERRTRTDGVGPGLLRGNAVHEAFVEAASRRPPDFSVNTIVDAKGEVTGVFCGHWIASHEAACGTYLENNRVEVDCKRDFVVVSCGGFPHDINMIQAHKALDSAARVCNDGGRIILLAECRDGLGRRDFLEWFSSPDSAALAERLCNDYRVNGQTAWSLLSKAERFDVRIVTGLKEEETSAMRLRKCASLAEATEGLDPVDIGYVLPSGAKVLAHTK